MKMRNYKGRVRTKIWGYKDLLGPRNISALVCYLVQMASGGSHGMKKRQRISCRAVVVAFRRLISLMIDEVNTVHTG